MLSFLVMSMFIRQLAGAPIPTYSTGISSTVSLLLYARVDGDSCAQSDQRSIGDIVWGCLVTIFACTWLAVHPNIPSPTDSRWCVFKRGLSTMTYALIAPELMVAWALHQYLGAAQIMRDFNTQILKSTKMSSPIFTFAYWLYSNPGDSPRSSYYRRTIKYIKRWFQEDYDGSGDVRWTKTHGFFMQMGGFMLYKDGVPVEVLTYQSLKGRIEEEEVDIPRITERTINDKSKSDYLSKGFVVVQTTWFVVQCIARWAKSLPLAELEVVTLAFAILNAITYALWLNKPQNVQEGIRIDLKPAGLKRLEISENRTYVTARSSQPSPLEPLSPLSSSSPTSGLPEEFHSPRSWLHRHLLGDYHHWRGSRHGLLWFITYRIPYRIITSALRPMKKLISCNPRERSSMRVPMFGYETLESPPPIMEPYLPCLIGMSFGLLHVIAWKSGPTELERQLWRCSTLVITIEPLLYAIAKRVTSRKRTGACLRDSVEYFLIILISFPFIIGLPAYVIARVALFTQALASLRQLPPAAFCDVDWGSFIPHL
jgi:hypothetical protein